MQHIYHQGYPEYIPDKSLILRPFECQNFFDGRTNVPIHARTHTRTEVGPCARTQTRILPVQVCTAVRLLCHRRNRRALVPCYRGQELHAPNQSAPQRFGPCLHAASLASIVARRWASQGHSTFFSGEGSAQVFYLLLRLLGHTTQTRCQTRRAEANNNNALNRKHWRILLCVLCASPSTLATVAGAKPVGAHSQRQHGVRKPSFDPWLFFLGPVRGPPS